MGDNCPKLPPKTTAVLEVQEMAERVCDLQAANGKSEMSVATQGDKVHSADKSLCGFDGDVDNDDNDIGGAN